MTDGCVEISADIFLTTADSLTARAGAGLRV